MKKRVEVVVGPTDTEIGTVLVTLLRMRDAYQFRHSDRAVLVAPEYLEALERAAKVLRPLACRPEFTPPTLSQKLEAIQALVAVDEEEQ